MYWMSIQYVKGFVCLFCILEKQLKCFCCAVHVISYYLCGWNIQIQHLSYVSSTARALDLNSVVPLNLALYVVTGCWSQ